MAATTYHIQIKKKYAGAIIKDLQKLDAVELITEAAIPEWQQKEVRKRVKKYDKNPDLLIKNRWDSFTHHELKYGAGKSYQYHSATLSSGLRCISGTQHSSAA